MRYEFRALEARHGSKESAEGPRKGVRLNYRDGRIPHVNFGIVPRLWRSGLFATCPHGFAVGYLPVAPLALRPERLFGPCLISSYGLWRETQPLLGRTVNSNSENSKSETRSDRSSATMRMLSNAGRSVLAARENLFVAEAAVGSFGSLENPFDHIFASSQASFLQPEDDIRFAAHGADFDGLFQTEIMRWNARID